MDYLSHPKNGYGQDGLPLQQELIFCENCNIEITDKNRPKHCKMCGQEGCMKCLKSCDNSYDYTCPSLECMNNYYKKFAEAVDMFRASLNRFILNCGDKNDD